MANPARRRWAVWCFRLALPLLLVVFAVPACRITDLPLWGPGVLPVDTYEVERIPDVAYYDGPEAAGRLHQLDLFLPRGLTGYPVVVLIHGGAWIMGDNRCCGLHSSLGEFLASRGIGSVLPNYRLSPEVKHPEHARDVARAVAWTRVRIADYGGRPDQIFLTGHSAGGHLVALVATDETYLHEQGLQTADIKGVIAVSGVYRIPPGKMEATLGGATPLAFRLDEVIPIRRGSGRHWPPPTWLPGLPIRLNVFGPAFGNDPEVRAAASPVNHVRPGLPPFLIVSAENDLPTLSSMAEEFRQALCAQGCAAELLTVEDRNHNSIMFRALTEADPVGAAMLAFIRRHTPR
ncbi:MAG: alpha/beta hydrolase [Gemmataceae bacterium]|nr:alpha/beta hydrolase [Gemmataceae bacterium]